MIGAFIEAVVACIGAGDKSRVADCCCHLETVDETGLSGQYSGSDALSGLVDCLR